MEKRFLKPLARRKPTRSQKRIIVLVCEGENTERDYFKALEGVIDQNKTQVTYYGGCGDPSAILRRAVNELRHLAEEKNGKKRATDEVWAIFDRDEHYHFDQTVADCARSKINVGYSNPCFEVWLIWHFEDYGSQDDRHRVQSHFQKLCPSYDPKKSKTANFTTIVENWTIAEARAKSHYEARTAEGANFGCPSSSLHFLTKSLFPRDEKKEAE